VKTGRIIAAAVFGFLFLLFVAADLALFGIVPLNSVVLTILPAAGLVLGAVLGGLAGKRQLAPQPPQEQMHEQQPFAPPTPL
jgi:energy-converting hydrogenase Eha subunit F